MIKIYLSFLVILALIFGVYRYITGLSDEGMERMLKWVPTISLIVLTAMFVATFIVVSF